MEAFKAHMQMARRSWTVLNRLMVRGGRLLRGANGNWVIDVGTATNFNFFTDGKIWVNTGDSKIDCTPATWTDAHKTDAFCWMRVKLDGSADAEITSAAT